MVEWRRVERHPATGAVLAGDPVVAALSEAIEVAHNPNLVPDTEAAITALIEPVLRAGWWEAAIHLMWPGEFLPWAPFHIEGLAWWSTIPERKSPDPLTACWPRGTGKSTLTSAALACCACLKIRPYMMWISDSYDQVVDKISMTAGLLKAPRVVAAFPHVALTVDRIGRFTTEGGVTADAGGMDQALRGRLLFLDRPGIIVLDDVETITDTAYIRRKKKDQVTKSIIPMGSDDKAIVFVQNLIHGESLMSGHMDGTADWLATRVVSGPWPQIRDLETEVETQTDGRARIVVVGGEPVWPEGRGLEVSQSQIDDEGLPSFLAEHQHETEINEGDLFPRDRWVYADVGPVGSGVKWCRAWDLAGTADPGADYTVGALMAVDEARRVWVVDVVRDQLDTGDVEDLVVATAEADLDALEKCVVLIESQPAAAGKAWGRRWTHDLLVGFRVELVPPVGSKPFRADGYSAAQQKAGVTLVNADWNGVWRTEHALFPKFGRNDDQVDAGAIGFNWLTRGGKRGRGGLASVHNRPLPGQ